MWQPRGMATGWLIRAGEDSRHAREFADNNVVAIGWPNIEGLDDLQGLSRAQILGRLVESRKSTTPEADANELLAFRDDVTVGDLVVTPDATTRDLLIGRVIGAYEYRVPSPAGDYRHVRSVRWIGRWDRDLAPEPLARELRYRRTIRRLTDQEGWAALADRIEAGEGRSPEAEGSPARGGTASRRRDRRSDPARRRCSECMQVLALTQFAEDAVVCRSCCE